MWQDSRSDTLMILDEFPLVIRSLGKSTLSLCLTSTILRPTRTAFARMKSVADWRGQSYSICRAKQLSRGEIGALLTYFRQWIHARVWDMNSHAMIENRRSLSKLRDSVQSIRSADDIGQWLRGAMKLGLDPLP
jgi:hypothetical protein